MEERGRKTVMAKKRGRQRVMSKEKMRKQKKKDEGKKAVYIVSVFGQSISCKVIF